MAVPIVSNGSVGADRSIETAADRARTRTCAWTPRASSQCPSRSLYLPLREIVHVSTCL
jgi:hypothetical protein